MDVKLLRLQQPNILQTFKKMLQNLPQYIWKILLKKFYSFQIIYDTP